MSSPIIVGSTGGSGTRIIQSIIEAQNIFMGAPLNAEKDALIIADYLEHHINPVLSCVRSVNYTLTDLPATLRNTTLSALENAINRMLSYKSSEQLRWGFKNPRSIFMLPFFEALYPDFTFVHVIRDGRDIALSENKNQPLKHFHAMFPSSSISADSAEAAILLWAKVNQEAAAWCARHKRNKYIRVYYESLCTNPEGEIKKMLEGLDVPQIEIAQATNMVAKSSSIGRWKKLPPQEQALLNASAHKALREFSYTT